MLNGGLELGNVENAFVSLNRKPTALNVLGPKNTIVPLLPWVCG
jgi:hypothetical protein